MNKTSTNSFSFIFIRPNKKKMCIQVTWKNIPKYFVLLSRNNPLMLKGLKSVDLKIIQMYHFRRKWKRYTVCTNWLDSNFFGVGLPLFPVGLLLFAEGSPELLLSKSKWELCISSNTLPSPAPYVYHVCCLLCNIAKSRVCPTVTVGFF